MVKPRALSVSPACGGPTPFLPQIWAKLQHPTHLYPSAAQPDLGPAPPLPPVGSRLVWEEYLTSFLVPLEGRQFPHPSVPERGEHSPSPPHSALGTPFSAGPSLEAEKPAPAKVSTSPQQTQPLSR